MFIGSGDPKPMNIVYVINSMSKSSGGPACTTLLTLQGMRSLGIDVKVLTNEVRSGEEPVSKESFIHYVKLPYFYNRRFGYSSAFAKALKEISKADIYHIQGIWQYQGYITAKFALEKHNPYVVTLHGALHPEALRYSSLIKKTALSFFQRKQLQGAACVHVTCMEEMEHYRSLGFTNPVAVIPNPIECGEPVESFFEDDVKRVGYLGRIQPYKRVDRLIEIWKKLNEPGELIIMGDGDSKYVSEIRAKASELELNKVRFTGWVSGIEKQRFLASLTCLVVPSDFENFGVIIPEALLQYVPVIASTAAPWEDLNSYKCGWWVDNDSETLTNILREALLLDKETLYNMGKRGRQLVLDKYAVSVVSEQMSQLYNWLSGNSGKPDFVFE